MFGEMGEVLTPSQPGTILKSFSLFHDCAGPLPIRLNIQLKILPESSQQILSWPSLALPGSEVTLSLRSSPQVQAGELKITKLALQAVKGLKSLQTVCLVFWSAFDFFK